MWEGIGNEEKVRRPAVSEWLSNFAVQVREAENVRIYSSESMRNIAYVIVIGLALSLVACKGKGNQQHDASAVSADSVANVAVHYAKGFQIRSMGNGIRLVDIHDPQGKKAEIYRFALVNNGVSDKDIPSGYRRIEIPLRKVICMTSLQLSNFIKLHAEDIVTGITSTRFLFHPHIRQRIAEGKIARIGIEGNFDTELIMAANPDVILFSPFKRGGYDALKDVNIPLIPHMGYKEMTPLGQAEWIKLVGLLIGKEKEATAVFDTIAHRYNELKALTAGVTPRPTVLSGEMRSGNWYAVGGKSFLAQLFEDAGADYFLKDDTHSGGLNLDFETVYSQAAHTDYWRIVNSYHGDFSYSALAEDDSRYADFDAFKHRKIIYCNMRRTPFYESMPVEPEIVLADLIHIFHPELLPQHQPKYYQLLK